MSWGENARLAKDGLEEQCRVVVEFLESELDVRLLEAWLISKRNDMIVL